MPVDSFCDSCLQLVLKKRLDANDLEVLHAIYDALIDFSISEGLGFGRFSVNFPGLSQHDLCEATSLSRHYVSRAVARLHAYGLIMMRSSGRKTLHHLTPEGYRACRLLYDDHEK